MTTLAIADRILGGVFRGPTPTIAEQTGMRLRTLRKHFDRSVGQSPKQLLRVARLQRALRQLHPRPWSGLRDSHLDDIRLEYFDDSHFAKDFKMLTSMSPQAYRKSKLRSGDPLINTVY
jgi:AraC-like DNA-binding protein